MNFGKVLVSFQANVGYFYCWSLNSASSLIQFPHQKRKKEKEKEGRRRMNLSKKGSLISLTKQSPNNKGPTLNPNAAEFVPIALKSPTGTATTPDRKAKLPASQGKQVLDRSESSISMNSDEEAQRYWQHQLPDDITPDFKVIGGEDQDRTLSLSLAGSSLHDGSDVNSYSPTTVGGYSLNNHLELDHHTNCRVSVDKMKYPLSSFDDDTSSANFFRWQNISWNTKNFINDRFIENSTDGPLLVENRRHGYANDMPFGEYSILENNEMNPLEYLALQFPGFAAESLAEVYFANACDLRMTIEILTQLELQVDGGFNQNIDPKTSSAPNLSSLDFPSLWASQNKSSLPRCERDEVPQAVNPYISDKDSMLLLKPASSLPSRGAVDFASAVRKLASQDSGLWKHGGTVLADSSLGSSRTSRNLHTSVNSGPVRDVYGDKFQSHGSTRAAPVWLETGHAVANLYSEMREEARDHARLRNAYFEQAQQAYLIGNKALAKELSARGQLHNVQMMAAHSKAQESIYRHRNPINPEVHGNGRGHESLIDLHGLHVSEAIHMLKNELAGLRSAARLAEQRLQVYICVGTGHHTKGSRTPPRLPVAVQRYLFEEEGLEYSEPQPGLLRVVIY